MGQISLIHIIFKVFEESILNPLYKILNKYSFQNEEDKIVVAKKFLIKYSLITIIFTIVILLLSSNILRLSKVPDDIFTKTNSVYSKKQSKMFTLDCFAN